LSNVLTIQRMFLLLLLMSGAAFSQQSGFKEILFLGMAEEGAPAVSQSFDQLLRTRLSAEAGIRISDYENSLRYRERLSFSRYPTISSGQLVKLQQILPDSLLLLWGRVVSTEIKPERSKLIGSHYDAELKINLSIFNPEQKAFIFNGIITSQKTFPGPTILFSSVEKTATLNAVERSAIIGELLENASSKSASMITSIVQNNRKIKAQETTPDKEPENSPSISDVFSVPSVEPQKIDDKEGNGAATK